MALRDTLNEKPAIAAGIAGGFVLIALIAAYFTFAGSSSGSNLGGATGKAFYTIDDGKTWFADSAEKLPPFDHDGKEAVGAVVYQCGGKQFVNHLIRYTPAGKTATLANEASLKSGKPIAPTRGRPAGLRQLKRPGTTTWIAEDDWSKVAQVRQVKCPDGGSGQPELVSP